MCPLSRSVFARSPGPDSSPLSPPLLLPPSLPRPHSRIWDTSTGQCLKTLAHEDNTPVASVRFSPNSKFLFTSTLDSAVRLWDYQNDKVVKSYEGHQNRKCVPLSPSSPPSPLLGATRPRALERLTRPPACRYCIPPILTPDGAHLVCGSEDHKVVVWDVQTREVVAQWAAHKGELPLLSSFPPPSSLARDRAVRGADAQSWSRRRRHDGRPPPDARRPRDRRPREGAPAPLSVPLSLLSRSRAVLTLATRSTRPGTRRQDLGHARGRGVLCAGQARGERAGERARERRNADRAVTSVLSSHTSHSLLPLSREWKSSPHK